MNHRLVFSLLGIGAVLAQQAGAAVTMTSAVPADNSTVKVISKISTRWDGEGMWLEPDEDVAISVIDSEGEQVARGYMEIDWDDMDAFDIVFSPSVSTPGSYTVEIPNNVFLDLTNTPVTLHYTVEGKSGYDVTLLRATPEPGSELTSLSKVDIYMESVMDITYNTSVRTRLVDADGETVATGKTSQDWNTNGHFTITFNPAVTASGNYELVIPANYFLDLDYYEKVTSAEIRLPYTIEGAAAPTTLAFQRAYPADGSEVTSLSEIKLYWETDLHTFTLREGTYATVTDGDGASTVWPVLPGDDNSQFVIAIDPEISEKGQYTITVPADIFLNSEGNEVTSPEVVLTYTVKPSDYKVPFEAYFVSSDPEAYEELPALSTVTTIWECDAEGVTLNPEAVADVTDEEGEAVTVGHLSLEEDATSLRVTVTLEEEITSDGTYVIIIPGNFLVDSEGDAVASERVVLPYVVDFASGTAIVSAETGVETLYGIDGRKVYGAPAPGIYIVVTSKGSFKRVVR